MKRNNNSNKKNNRKLRIAFILWFSQFFTSAPWGILPSTSLIDPADNSYIYITHFFLSPPFLFFFILEFRNLFLSVSSDLYCVLFCSLLVHPSLFFSTLLSLPGSVFSHSVYSLHFLILIVFFSNLLFFSLSLLLYSTYLSLMFYCYWICSLFVILHLFFIFRYSSLSNTYLLSIFLLLLFSLNTFF